VCEREGEGEIRPACLFFFLTPTCTHPKTQGLTFEGERPIIYAALNSHSPFATAKSFASTDQAALDLQHDSENYFDCKNCPDPLPVDAAAEREARVPASGGGDANGDAATPLSFWRKKAGEWGLTKPWGVAPAPPPPSLGAGYAELAYVQICETTNPGDKCGVRFGFLKGLLAVSAPKGKRRK
jgi:hypothetical protein